MAKTARLTPPILPCNCPHPPTLCAAETKIQELAGIVKLLRRGLKEMQTKSSEFIAAACKYEKEVGQQVGGWVQGGRWGVMASGGRCCWGNICKATRQQRQ